MKKKYTHASIIPLIGGMTLASEEVFGTPPEYMLSYAAFADNEKHLIHHYEQKGLKIPYHVLDQGQKPKRSVDVVSSTCPCAGLSQYSMTAGPDNPTNRWMLETTEYILSELRPRVFWGENSPNLVGKIGSPIRDKLYATAEKNGYSMLVYLTKSTKHGNPQVRKRCFYFFFRDTGTPVFERYDRPQVKIEDLMRSIKSNFQMEPINLKTPSKDDPYYRYLLEVIHGGLKHREYSKMVAEDASNGADVLSQIEKSGHDLMMVSEWLRRNGHDKEADKCARKHIKIVDGGNIMRRHTIVPKGRIGAFVGHYPSCLTHPDHDRYVTYREAMTIMGLPDDFELLDPKNSANHICQNVPVGTARDMATEVKAYLDGERRVTDSGAVFQCNLTGRSTELVGVPGSTLEAFV